MLVGVPPASMLDLSPMVPSWSARRWSAARLLEGVQREAAQEDASVVARPASRVRGRTADRETRGGLARTAAALAAAA